MIKFLPYILVFTLLAATYILGHVKGTATCQASQASVIIKGDENHDKIEQKVMSLSDIELRNSFCQFVRDDKSKCLQAHIPISE